MHSEREELKIALRFDDMFLFWIVLYYNIFNVLVIFLLSIYI